MYFIILVHFWLLSQVICGPNVVYKTKNIECLTNPKYVENVSCSLKAINWNKAVAEMDCYLIIPLRNFSVNLKVLKKDYSNKYQPFLVDVVVNACDVLSKKNYLTYGTILQKFGKQFTNINHSCPLENHMFARGFYIDQNHIPDAPIGFYQIVLVIFENFADKPREEYGTIKLYVQAMERLQTRTKQPSTKKFILNI